MGKRIRLKKDIVIPAGTVFRDVRGEKVQYGEGNYEHTLGLTDNSFGTIVYGFDRADPAIWDWFEEVSE